MTIPPVSTVFLSRNAPFLLEPSEKYNLHRLPGSVLDTLRLCRFGDGFVEVGEIAKAVSIRLTGFGIGDGNSLGRPSATGRRIPCAERDPPPGQAPRELPTVMAKS